MWVHKTNGTIDGMAKAPPMPNDGNWTQMADNDASVAAFLAPPAVSLPDWAGLGCEFRAPGNALYMSVYAKVDDADRWRNGQLLTLTFLLGLGSLTNTQAKVSAASLVKDHFANFKTFILSGDVRSTSHLAMGIQKLASLLTDAGYGLSATDISSWNALIDKYNFPASCKL
ncbi:MAG: hypothetical protein KME27_10510 [Lyngbya sp. HA4199-MV5]|jgi:hypothetical protein|nr:hypothetical protein [Lyngbya sp. HA4199-MV5]